jgi:hypothetical protein
VVVERKLPTKGNLVIFSLPTTVLAYWPIKKKVGGSCFTHLVLLWKVVVTGP